MSSDWSYEQPLFEVSIVGGVILYLVCGAFILLIVANNLITETNWPTSEIINAYAFIVFWSLLCAYPIVRIYLQRVRVAKFYPDRFTIRGRKTNKEFRYQDIEDVATEKSLSQTKVALKIRGSSNLLVIPRNPKNRDLKTDLFSWLQNSIKSDSS